MHFLTNPRRGDARHTVALHRSRQTTIKLPIGGALILGTAVGTQCLHPDASNARVHARPPACGSPSQATCRLSARSGGLSARRRDAAARTGCAGMWCRIVSPRHSPAELRLSPRRAREGANADAIARAALLWVPARNGHDATYDAPISPASKHTRRVRDSSPPARKSLSALTCDAPIRFALVCEHRAHTALSARTIAHDALRGLWLSVGSPRCGCSSPARRSSHGRPEGTRLQLAGG